MSDEFLEHTKRFKDSNGFNYNVLEAPYNLVQLCLHAYKEANGLFFFKIESRFVFESLFRYLLLYHKNGK